MGETITQDQGSLLSWNPWNQNIKNTKIVFLKARTTVTHNSFRCQVVMTRDWLEPPEKSAMFLKMPLEISLSLLSACAFHSWAFTYLFFFFAHNKKLT